MILIIGLLFLFFSLIWTVYNAGQHTNEMRMIYWAKFVTILGPIGLFITLVGVLMWLF